MNNIQMNLIRLKLTGKQLIRQFSNSGNLWKQEKGPKAEFGFGTAEVKRFKFPKHHPHQEIVKDLDKKVEELNLDAVKRPNIKYPMILHCISYEAIKKQTNLPPIILLHGFLNNTTVLSGTARALNRTTRRPVYAMDLRNHGCSSRRFPHDYPTMAIDVIHTIESQKLGRVSLVGHSMGAKVAMLVALKRPDLVHNLVIVENSPVEQDITKIDRLLKRLLVGMCDVEAQTVVKYNRKHKLYPPLFHDTTSILRSYKIADSTIRLMLTNLILRKKFRVRSPVLAFLKYNVFEELGKWPDYFIDGFNKFEKPVLVVKAQNSRFISEKDITEEFPKYFTNFEVSRVNTGHMPFLEDHETFIEILGNFFNKIRELKQQERILPTKKRLAFLVGDHIPDHSVEELVKENAWEEDEVDNKSERIE